MLAVAAKVVFGLVLVNVSANQNQFRYPKPIIPLFRAVVTVMAKWLYIEPMAIWSYIIAHLLSLSKIRALLGAFYIMRYIENAKGWLYF